MNIGFTYNVRHVKPDINDPRYLEEAEFDEPATIAGIISALEALGHTVWPVEADEDAYEKLRTLKTEGKADLVFNFAEGRRGADREAQIPAILEMLAIPYTGPKPLVYAIGLHKVKTKEVLSYHGIPTPRWVEVKSEAELAEKPIDFFPAIAKPVSEGSSKGIRAKNLAANLQELKPVVGDLLRDFKQPVLVEEFLDGREFTVAVLGAPPAVLPIIEVTFDALPPGLPKFDHFEAKWIFDNPASSTDPLICPAVLTPDLEQRIRAVCLKSFAVLEMADWARFDLRLDKNNVPQVIEVNCPPGIIPDPKENSRFPRAARAAGLDFGQMLAKILQSACRRYNIEYKN